MVQRPSIDIRSLAALIAEWVVIVLAIAFALRSGTWWAWAAAFIVVATRQHGLLMLYHDAVHGLLARTNAVNDFLINLLVGVPHLIPVEVYRPLHLKHHRTLGSSDDPERKLLYAGQPWRYRPLRTWLLIRQLSGDLFVLNGMRTMAAWRGEQKSVAVRPATLVAAVLWAIFIALLIASAPAIAGAVLLLWFVPLLTLTNLLQKLRSFAEHSGGPGVTPAWPDWTYTWRVSWPGRLTIWPYNINYHLEHHAQPHVPWHSLPQVAVAPADALDSRSFWSLLHR